MGIFISHNSADKPTARALATLLVEQGVDVWFDEWNIALGDSIVGGIEKGLKEANIFVILWSANARDSNWVSTETNAFIRKRIDDYGLKIIPLMVDSTPMPVLLADFRGYDLSSGVTLDQVIAEMLGHPRDIEVAARLQKKINELTEKNTDPHDPLPYLICPTCGSADLNRSSACDTTRDEMYYLIDCTQCNWSDWTQ